jgi:hypothetical protein
VARWNGIVVCGAVLAPLILGFEGYALIRSHHKGHFSAGITDPSPVPASPARPATAAATTAPPTAEPITWDDARIPSGRAELAQNSALEQRRRALLEHRLQVVREADEEMFDRLNLPNDKRAAIRAIDDRYVHALTAMDDRPSSADFRAEEPDLNAEQTRRTEITTLLGVEEMGAFNLAEREAERRARVRLRSESVRGR